MKPMSAADETTDCAIAHALCTTDQFCSSDHTCHNRLPTSGVTADFMTCPSAADIASLDRDFDITFYDSDRDPNPSSFLHGLMPNTHWDRYPYSCDMRSHDPQRYIVYNTLKFLRDIRFSRPLPFTSGSLYSYLTLHNGVSSAVHLDDPVGRRLKIVPRLDCNHFPSTSYLEPVTTSTFQIESTFAPEIVSYAFEPDFATCGYRSTLIPLAAPETVDGFVYSPVARAATIVHEAQHGIAHVGHTDGPNNDATLDEMGAYAAQFYFDAWVSLYSTNTDEYTRNLAAGYAGSVLRHITVNKCPADASLRSVVNQIQPGTCTP